jgi:hypothetical protein
MHDLSRLHHVTANYEAYQGLRLVPTALPVAYGGVAALAGGALEGAVGLAGFLGSVALAVGLGAFIARWYTRRYGVVRPTKEQKRATAVRSLAAVAVVGAAALAGIWLDPPVPVFGLAMAAVLALYYRSVGSMRAVHALGTVAIALVSLLPLVGVADGTTWGALFLTTAAAFVVVGLADHRYLSVALPPSPEQA